jgi:hypothetical protein
MDDIILNFIADQLDMSVKREYLFSKVCGFTFVFKREVLSINDKVTSAEIRPAGIIYEENGEYYYAPLHDGDEIDEIVQGYVKNICTAAKH